MDAPQTPPQVTELPTFVACVGGRFRVTPAAGEPVELELVEARGLPGQGREGGREPFTLLFRGPNDPFLPQGIYPFEHGSVGSVEVFIVPLGPDGQGHRYEAVFN